MSARYQRLVRLLDLWTIESTKPGRDLGEHLHTVFKDTLADLPEKQVAALERLANNTYFNAYPRAKDTSSTSLTPDQCKVVLSEGALEEINKYGKSLQGRIGLHLHNQK